MARQVEVVDRFELHRRPPRAAAFRLLGSVEQADAVVQEAQARLGTSGAAGLDRELITIADLCLDRLRDREIPEWHVPDVVVIDADEHGPEDAALLGGSVGVALYTALDGLSPEERVAFVLHDSAGVPFDQVGEVVGVSATAAEHLAAVARDRIGHAPIPDAELAHQLVVVTAYFRAVKRGDLEGTRALLHDDVVVRSDAGEHAFSALVTDAATAAHRAVMFGRIRTRMLPALVNDAAGVVVVAHGEVLSVVAVTVVGDRIAEIDALHDPQRLATMGLSAFLSA